MNKSGVWRVPLKPYLPLAAPRLAFRGLCRGATAYTWGERKRKCSLKRPSLCAFFMLAQVTAL